MAVRAAKEKAELMCNELDVNLGNPVSIVEGYSNGFGNSQNYISYETRHEESSQSTMPIGQIEIRASVNVVFEIGNHQIESCFETRL
jgi:uncharacterized protein YggE